MSPGMTAHAQSRPRVSPWPGLPACVARTGRAAAMTLCLIPAMTVVAASEVSPAEQKGRVLFEKKIRPVLVENCYECHSAKADKMDGGLRLDTREGIRTGGDSGPAVIPGDPDASLLLEALRYEGLEMPPESKLPNRVIKDFARWVETGAPDPREGNAVSTGSDPQPADAPESEALWSFEPPEKPAVPKVNDRQWPRTPIDRFVLARLESEQLTPVSDADRRTLLRRLYFDLIGLPPSPDQIDAFLSDRSPSAVERVTDHLLASPRFGERWGRHWLDIARFAESTGERGRLYPEAWRYRDYVIHAFNEDRPYDRFIQEQIAGDLLEAEDYRKRQQQLTATGFLAFSPVTFEQQDKVQLEWDMIDDQIDTLGRSVMALTMGCARCHDHMNDPITTEDYYSLAGIFASTKSLEHGNISDWIENDLPISAEHESALEEHNRSVARLEKQLERARQELEALQGHPEEGPRAIEDLPGVVVDDIDAEKEGSWQDSTHHPTYVGDGYIHDNREGKGERSIRFTADLPKAGEYEVRLSYTPGGGRAPNVPVTVAHADGQEIVNFGQQEKPPIQGLFKKIGRFPFEDGEAWVQIDTHGTDGYYVIADAVQFVPVEATDSEPSPEVLAQIADQEAQIEELEARLEDLEAQAPPARPKAMGVREAEEARDVAVRIRGDAHREGDRVPRGIPAALNGKHSLTIGDDESGRLQLARWLTQPDHPLTARVWVNRVWHHLLGRGLVRTPDNFGNSGQEPSHPKLLDWLAVRFVEQGWSTKWLIREITRSRVYQLSSSQNPVADRIDPENHLLWRANRKRLEVEPFRDAMLDVAGELDLAVGGRVIRPGTPNEYGYEYRTLRRSTYVPVFRVELYEMFDLFDFPPPTMVTGKRATTTLPTQALFLMNSPWVMDRARAAARRLLEETDGPRSERVNLAYERTLGRPPTPKEQAQALEFLDAELTGPAAADPEAGRLTAWARLWQVLFASIDFRYLD